MKRIGLFFGSFNPIHVGHLVIGNYMANYTDLDEVWFVVSPQSPFKKKASLASSYDRLEMVELAIAGVDRLRASDIEFHLPIPSYTIDTLTYLHERHPSYSFSLIMGEDNLENFKKWKNADVLLSNYSIHVYPRPGYRATDLRTHPKVTITESPLMEISSTFIRKAISEDKSIDYLVPQTVKEYIDQKALYL